MDYISKPALMGKLTSSEEQQKIKAMSGADAYNEFLTLVNATEKADVAPVRHGRWEWLGPNLLARGCMCGTCSVCKVRSKYIVNTGICPNCGAWMGGGAGNG